ncbi:MAG: MBL fold metallo-hydrolase [Magnetococcales bacterium]|nr:MBL fold metallo-hydrolase [Magnetococcales bacterium]
MSGYQEIHAGVTCIDVGYVRPGFAAAWLIREGERAVFVETGPLPSVPRLLACLRAKALAPDAVEAVIVTHVHLDHAGGAGALLHHLPNARLLTHPAGVAHLTDPSRLVAGAMEVYGEALFLATLAGAVPVDPARIDAVPDGECFRLGERRLTLLHTPGHSLNHLCVWDEASRCLFSGDACGIAYPACAAGDRPFLFPATTPTQFDPEQYVASVRRLADLRPEWLCLTHFGPLPWSDALVGDLEEMVARYRDLAMTLDESLPQEAWVAALTALTRERMAQLGGADQTLAWLREDMTLNAQGLALWKKRMARRGQ